MEPNPEQDLCSEIKPVFVLRRPLTWLSNDMLLWKFTNSTKTGEKRKRRTITSMLACVLIHMLSAVLAYVVSPARDVPAAWLSFQCIIIIPLQKPQCEAEHSTWTFMLWLLTRSIIVFLSTGMLVESTEYTRSWTTPGSSNSTTTSHWTQTRQSLRDINLMRGFLLF